MREEFELVSFGEAIVDEVGRCATVEEANPRNGGRREVKVERKNKMVVRLRGEF